MLPFFREEEPYNEVFRRPDVYFATNKVLQLRDIQHTNIQNMQKYFTQQLNKWLFTQIYYANIIF